MKQVGPNQEELVRGLRLSMVSGRRKDHMSVAWQMRSSFLGERWAVMCTGLGNVRDGYQKSVVSDVESEKHVRTSELRASSAMQVLESLGSVGIDIHLLCRTH